MGKSVNLDDSYERIGNSKVAQILSKDSDIWQKQGVINLSKNFPSVTNGASSAVDLAASMFNFVPMSDEEFATMQGPFSVIATKDMRVPAFMAVQDGVVESIKSAARNKTYFNEAGLLHAYIEFNIPNEERYTVTEASRKERRPPEGPLGTYARIENRLRRNDVYEAEEVTRFEDGKEPGRPATRQQRRAVGYQDLMPTGEKRDHFKIHIPAKSTLFANEVAQGINVKERRPHDVRGHLRTDKYGRKRIRVRDHRRCRNSNLPYFMADYDAVNVGME
ncbi:unnamed protein product [Sphagnum compactum]